VNEFKLVFDMDKIDIDQVTQAIAEFEKTLVTPNAPFDRYLMGTENAISAKAKAGYELFKTSGCVACHHGPAVGGSSYRKMGVVEPYQTEFPRWRRRHSEGGRRYYGPHPAGKAVHRRGERENRCLPQDPYRRPAQLYLAHPAALQRPDPTPDSFRPIRY